MSQILTHQTASSMGAVDGLIPNSGTSPVTPDANGDISIITNTPDVNGTPTGVNPTTTIGSLNTVTITQNFQTLVSASTAISATADIFTYPMDSGTGVVVEARIIGVDPTGANAWGGSIIGAAAYDGASISIDYEDKNCDGPDVVIQANFVASGSDLILRITGSDTSAYTWNALVTYLEV